jgi:hypothetical protein
MSFTFHRHCPSCLSEELFKSRYRWLEFILPLFLFRPVRCNSCLQRHYRPIFYHASERPLREQAAPAERRRSA